MAVENSRRPHTISYQRVGVERAATVGLAEQSQENVRNNSIVCCAQSYISLLCLLFMFLNTRSMVMGEREGEWR